MLPNNVYLVRKLRSHKTQVLRRMRLRHFTPHQSTLDIQFNPRKWKPDPEDFIKRDGLYARAWECEYEKSIFDDDYNNTVTPISLEVTVRSEVAANETSTTQGTIRRNSPGKFPQAVRSREGTDTDHYKKPHAEKSVEQLNPTSTKPRSLKYDLRHNPKPNCNENYRYWMCTTAVYGTHTYTFRKS